MTVIRTPNDIKQMMEKIEEANIGCELCPTCKRKTPVKHSHGYIPSAGLSDSWHTDQYTCKMCGTVWISKTYVPILGFTDEEVEEMAQNFSKES